MVGFDLNQAYNAQVSQANTQTSANASMANAWMQAMASMSNAQTSANADMATTQMQIQAARRNLMDQLAAQSAIARMENATNNRQIQAQLQAAREKIQADIASNAQNLSAEMARFQATLAEQQRQFGATHALNTRMQEAQEFANPNDWVKQAFYLRNLPAPASGQMTAAPDMSYTPGPIPSWPNVNLPWTPPVAPKPATPAPQTQGLAAPTQQPNPPTVIPTDMRTVPGFADGGTVDPYQTFAHGAAGGIQTRTTGGDPKVGEARAANVPTPGSAEKVKPVNAVQAVNTRPPTKPLPPGAVPLEGYSNVAVRVNPDGTKEFYQADADGYWVLTSFVDATGQLKQTGQSGAPSDIQQAVGRPDVQNPATYAPNPAAGLERANQGIGPTPVNPTGGVQVATGTPPVPPAPPSAAPGGPPVHGTTDVPPVTGSFEQYLQRLQNSSDPTERAEGFGYSNQGLTTGVPAWQQFQQNPTAPSPGGSAAPPTNAPTTPSASGPTVNISIPGVQSPLPGTPAGTPLQTAPVAQGVGPTQPPTPEELIVEAAREAGVEVSPQLIANVRRSPVTAGFAHGGQVATAQPGQPVVVGERGPEIVSLPPGARVIPMDGVMKTGTPPMYQITPANVQARQLIGEGALAPWAERMIGAAGGIESGGNWTAPTAVPTQTQQPGAAPVAPAAPSTPPRTVAAYGGVTGGNGVVDYSQGHGGLTITQFLAGQFPLDSPQLGSDGTVVDQESGLRILPGGYMQFMVGPFRGQVFHATEGYTTDLEGNPVPAAYGQAQHLAEYQRQYQEKAAYEAQLARMMGGFTQPTPTPQTPATPQNPTTGGAYTGGVTTNTGAQSGTNPFGYNASDLARMPWIGALSGGSQGRLDPLASPQGQAVAPPAPPAPPAPTTPTPPTLPATPGVKVPAFQAYGGPLSLSDIPAPPGKQNPFGPGFPSVPAPHQIPLQQWVNLTPQEQQMALGYYRALGFLPDDVDTMLRRQAPGLTSGTPTAWRV